MAEDTKFLVRITECTGEDFRNQAGNIPDGYLKFNWDHFKTFETEKSARDPILTWPQTFRPGEAVTFEYKTKRKFARSALFNQKKLDIEVWDKNFFANEYIGKTDLDLETIATGPTHLSLLVRDQSGNKNGRIKMTVEMTELSTIQVIFKDVKVTSSNPQALSLVYYFNADSQTRQAAQQEANRFWADLNLLTWEGSLKQLVEHAILIEAHAGSEVVGIAKLEPKHLLLDHAPHNTEVHPFKLDMASPHGASFGIITGKVMLCNIPHFAQMEGTGQSHETGVVDAGRPLLKWVPVPKSLAPKTAADLCPLYDARALQHRHSEGGDQIANKLAGLNVHGRQGSMPTAPVAAAPRPPPVAPGVAVAGFQPPPPPPPAAPPPNSSAPPPPPPSYPPPASAEPPPAYPGPGATPTPAAAGWAKPTPPYMNPGPPPPPPPQATHPPAAAGWTPQPPPAAGGYSHPPSTGGYSHPAAAGGYSAPAYKNNAGGAAPAYNNNAAAPNYSNNAVGGVQVAGWAVGAAKGGAAQPGGLPDGWEERTDASTGRKYYQNRLTKSTQWEKPTAAPTPPPPAGGGAEVVPPGWQVMYTPDGKKYYQNKDTKTTSWTLPKASGPPRASGGLPPGWEQKWDAKQERHYYVNHQSKVTQWHPPTV